VTLGSTNIDRELLGFLRSWEKVMFGASFLRRNDMLLIANRCLNSRMDFLVHHSFQKSGCCEARVFSQVTVKSEVL